MSKGADKLKIIVEEIFPNQIIQLEYNVADRGGLFIDIFLPALDIGFEYDGEQHFKFIEHFHGDRQTFAAARRRDLSKDDACQAKNITLIRVAYNEPMDKNSILEKIEVALDG